MQRGHFGQKNDPKSPLSGEWKKEEIAKSKENVKLISQFFLESMIPQILPFYHEPTTLFT